jgi:hypothetical protein
MTWRATLAILRGVLIVAALASCGSPPGQMARSSDAAACRCIQQPLATYYEQAEEVLFARVVEVRAASDDITADSGIGPSPGAIGFLMPTCPCGG